MVLSFFLTSSYRVACAGVCGSRRTPRAKRKTPPWRRLFRAPDGHRPDNGPVLDPDVAAVLLAAAFAGVLALPGLRKAVRRGERFCVSCGRRVLLGQKTCDCDD
jgi:hypothetical protein